MKLRIMMPHSKTQSTETGDGGLKAQTILTKQESWSHLGFCSLFSVYDETPRSSQIISSPLPLSVYIYMILNGHSRFQVTWISFFVVFWGLHCIIFRVAWLVEQGVPRLFILDDNWWQMQDPRKHTSRLVWYQKVAESFDLENRCVFNGFTVFFWNFGWEFCLVCHEGLSLCLSPGDDGGGFCEESPGCLGCWWCWLWQWSLGYWRSTLKSVSET